MCFESIETKAVVEEKVDWLMSIPGVKSLVARLNGASLGQPKMVEGDEEWLLLATDKLTKFVGEASEQLSTVSEGLIANLTGSSETYANAIDGAEEVRSSKMPIVAWELPNLLGGVGHELPRAWSTIVLFWEKSLFGKAHDESTYVSLDEPNEDHSNNEDGNFSNCAIRQPGTDVIVGADVQYSVVESPTLEQNDDAKSVEETCATHDEESGTLASAGPAPDVAQLENQGKTTPTETSGRTESTTDRVYPEVVLSHQSSQDPTQEN
jgi:hypothetical protein